jgi:ribosomal protein S27AE
VAYLFVCFFFGLAGGVVGKVKGSSFLVWFLISAIVPIGGLIAALLYRIDRDELRRECPTCGKVVKLHDQLCPRCGEELYFPEVAIASEAASRSRAAEAQRH